MSFHTAAFFSHTRPLLSARYKMQVYKWVLVCQKQVSRAGTSWVRSPPGPRKFIGSFVGLYAFPCARVCKLNQQIHNIQILVCSYLVLPFIPVTGTQDPKQYCCITTFCSCRYWVCPYTQIVVRQTRSVDLTVLYDRVWRFSPLALSIHISCLFVRHAMQV